MKFSYNKLKAKVNTLLVLKTKKYFFYPIIYKSWWNFYLNKNKYSEINKNNYFTSVPNQRAGIGHQLANWIAGYWFSKKFGLNFTHISFSNKEWDDFLGFKYEFIELDELLKKGYKKVILPLFDENSINEVNKIKNIIKSYGNKKIVFITEQDQFYFDQFGVINDIQKIFYSSKERKKDKLIFEKGYFNIAIHIRRGDITVGQLNKNPNLLMRWQDNNYFINVLDNVINTLKKEQIKIKIYLFSQGKKEDYPEFHKYENILYCLDMNAKDSFLHMVYADLLITSKSSFSYKPALLSKGIKISPENFWHGYPNDKNWIIADEKGDFEENLLIENTLLKNNS